MYRALDVMGFAGGFTLGMVRAGFTLAGKQELPGGFGVANCEANRHLLGERWTAEVGDWESWSAPSADVVFGNPPCSGFSVMSASHFRGADSPVNHCMWTFVRQAARVRPVVAAFESVQMARTRPDGLDLMRRLRVLLEDLTDARWSLTHVRHNAYELGGAAVRRRYFWVASRVPFGIEPPHRPVKPTLNEVIDDLGGLAQTWEPQPYRAPVSWWSKERRSDAGVVDGHISLDTPLTRRVADLIAEVGWEPGESIAQVARRCYERTGRLPASFAATEKKLIASNFSMGFTTPVRWRGENPARVITGGSLCTVIHPTADRMITHREAARVMGFPDDWRLRPLRGRSGLFATHGKGITVDCGEWLGGWIRAALDGQPGGCRGREIGEREYDLDVTDMRRPILV